VRIAAVLLVAVEPVGSWPFALGLTLLVASQLYIYVRTAGLATIGSDHLTLLICGGAWLAVVVGGTPLALRAGLWFVAGQACLSYLVAGVAKLTAPKWRSGQAMPLVLSTYLCGSPVLYQLVQARPWLAKVMSWSVMLWETVFPVVLVAPRPLVLPMLAVGVLFHASLAAMMGLNLFLFAFPASYVAIWAVTR
jgi:hypothetical protein